jgi:hypothetical protein
VPILANVLKRLGFRRQIIVAMENWKVGDVNAGIVKKPRFNGL